MQKIQIPENLEWTSSHKSFWSNMLRSSNRKKWNRNWRMTTFQKDRKWLRCTLPGLTPRYLILNLQQSCHPSRQLPRCRLRWTRCSRMASWVKKNTTNACSAAAERSQFRTTRMNSRSGIRKSTIEAMRMKHIWKTAKLKCNQYWSQITNWRNLSLRTRLLS